MRKLLNRLLEETSLAEISFVILMLTATFTLILFAIIDVFTTFVKAVS